MRLDEQVTAGPPRPARNCERAERAEPSVGDANFSRREAKGHTERQARQESVTGLWGLPGRGLPGERIGRAGPYKGGAKGTARRAPQMESYTKSLMSSLSTRQLLGGRQAAVLLQCALPAVVAAGNRWRLSPLFRAFKSPDRERIARHKNAARRARGGQVAARSPAQPSKAGEDRAEKYPENSERGDAAAAVQAAD